MKHIDHSADFRLLPGKDGVASVIAVVTLRRIAVELLGLFSPLYILGIAQSLGYSTKAAILMVVIYFFLIFLAKLLAMPLAENASFRMGYRRTLVLSVIPFFLFISCLILSQSQPSLLVLVSLFWGIHAAFFWFGYHGLFVKRADQEHFGKQTGIAQALYILAAVITPIFGGLIILELGYEALFLVAGAIFALGVMVALLSGEIKPHRDAHIVEVIQLFKTHKKMVVAYFGWGLEGTIYSAVWPVFLFLLVGKILSFGEIVSAAVLLAAIITYLVGLIVDQIGGKNIINLGAIVGFLSWILRAVVRAPLAIIGVDGLYRMTEQMLTVPLNVLSYKKAVDGGTGQALYFREISITIGSLVSLLLVAILVFFNLPLWTPFILASLGALAPIFATRR